MQNLKIRVMNEQESHEAQELFFELGYVWADTKCKTEMRYTRPVYYSAFDDGDLCCDEIDVNSKHKEITLPELRAMVEQEQDEPFLTPETTLNDQYAEIEKVRQDMVNHPNHYTQGKVECIDALESATIGKSGIEAVCVANVIKYLWRYEQKNGLEDVKKAQFYLNRLVATLENNNG